MEPTPTRLPLIAFGVLALSGCNDFLKHASHASTPPGVSGTAAATTQSALVPAGTSLGTAGAVTISTVAGEVSPVITGTAGPVSVRTGFYPTPLDPHPPVTIQ